MDKNAKELIQKMAGIPQGLKDLRSGGGMAHMPPSHQTYAAGRSNANLFGQRAAKTPAGPDRSADIEVGKGQKAQVKSSSDVKKTSSMKNIIADIIKGAEQNTFGRPVTIQADVTDWSPIDMAKVAGMVVALSEKGYTNKEAAEYLGMHEDQLTLIIKTVG